MQEKLRRCGIRSLGPVVDVTNYVLLELGQPMHAFDLGRLSGSIQVRYARPGEQLTLLDERTIALDEDTLLICDQDKALALAGVMGGMDSGISAATRDLFLEVAFFSPESIAGRARRHGLATDSSYRFERGVDPELQHRAMERATALLLDLVGGQAGPVIEALAAEHLPRRQPVALRRARIETLLGFAPDDRQVETILGALGMQVDASEQGWRVTPPSYRFDLVLEVDLIEEVGRVYGYNRLPSTRYHGELTMRPIAEASTPLERLHTLLVDRDYQEVVTYSFVDGGSLRLLAPDLAPVELANPISTEMGVMRTTLWTGLVNAVRHNLARQQTRVRAFESGLTFKRVAGTIEQHPKLAGLVYGEVSPEQWGLTTRSADFFDIKADLQSVLQQVADADEFRFEAARRRSSWRRMSRSRFPPKLRVLQTAHIR